MQTALIVDDESLIAMSAADLFQAAGYETIEACSADKAIRQLESNANIAIVKVDMKYSDFTRSNYVTIANTGNGWKITNVYSTFS